MEMSEEKISKLLNSLRIIIYLNSCYLYSTQPMIIAAFSSPMAYMISISHGYGMRFGRNGMMISGRHANPPTRHECKPLARLLHSSRVTTYPYSHYVLLGSILCRLRKIGRRGFYTPASYKGVGVLSNYQAGDKHSPLSVGLRNLRPMNE